MEKKDFVILFVDDESNNLVSFKATFRRDYQVFTAMSAKEGLTLLRDHEVHLIITDQRMPEMTGVEFLQKIIPIYPETIRMIITGFSDIEAVIDAINKGQVYRYINKPWDEREMRMTIENARQLYGLKKENIRSQFEALKTQVNPHFLFNNLNVLSSLIYIDQDSAGKFVRQLSKVYRYVLDFKDADTISLQEELDFLDAYIFLLTTRFGDNLQVERSLKGNCKSCRIPPAVTQMLIENAIKHNVIARNRPLTIQIYTDDTGYLTIQNTLQRKSSVEPSSRIGLENIRKRYQYLSAQQVIIQETPDAFIVKIPLL